MTPQLQPGTRGHILSPFETLTNPILTGRPPQTGLRDPALYIHRGTVHLFYTACEWDGVRMSSWIEQRTSLDLQTWSVPSRISDTPGLCSPGNVVWTGEKFVLCCQHLPISLPLAGLGLTRHDCRLWLLESDDLHHWSDPIAVQPGGSLAEWRDSPRMIDAYLIPHADEWYMMYKGHANIGGNEHGGLLGMLKSRDLVAWEEIETHRPLFGDPNDPRGVGYENPCVIRFGDRWRCFVKVCDGQFPLGVCESDDLLHWTEPRPLEVEMRPWMSTPPNAPMVVDAREWYGVWLMAYHCDRLPFPLSGDLGLAWSHDGESWETI